MHLTLPALIHTLVLVSTQHTAEACAHRGVVLCCIVLCVLVVDPLGGGGRWEGQRLPLGAVAADAAEMQPWEGGGRRVPPGAG